MKKFAIETLVNVVTWAVFIAIIVIVFGSHVTVVQTGFTNRVYHGDGYVYATRVEMETKLLGGEIVSTKEYDVSYRQDFREFLAEESDVVTSVTIGFR